MATVLTSRQNIKKVAILFRTAPYGTSCGREGLDASLGLSVYLTKLSLFFVGDGIFQLMINQQPKFIYQQANVFKLLNIYDISDLYLCCHSLQQRKLHLQQLQFNKIQLLSAKEINNHLTKQDVVLSF